MKKLILKITPRFIINFYHKLKRKVISRHEASLKESEYRDYLKKWYKKMTGKELNLYMPINYTEKQQWLKLYDRDTLKTQLSDKYLVRDYIKKIIGEEYLIPIISIDGKDCWTNADDINFEKLPGSFVLKCNHGSGYNIIIKNKESLNNKKIKKIKKKINCWLKENYAFHGGLELQYKDIKPLIYIEQYMAINDDLPDYKFMCFSGEVKYVWVDTGRYKHHRRSVYDLNFNQMPFSVNKYDPILNNVQPENFKEMLPLVQKLCGDWKFVRVDLYNINGKIYFGELTFSSESGIAMIFPEGYNEILGKDIQIDVK